MLDNWCQEDYCLIRKRNSPPSGYIEVHEKFEQYGRDPNVDCGVGPPYCANTEASHRGITHFQDFQVLHSRAYPWNSLHRWNPRKVVVLYICVGLINKSHSVYKTFIKKKKDHISSTKASPYFKNWSHPDSILWPKWN